MNIGILGTGVVGQTIGSKLVSIGNRVVMGSRTSDNPAAREWADRSGDGAAIGTFADAAAHGEILINCTNGVSSLRALELAGAENIGSKILIDIANPLDFSKGFPPTLSVCNTDSLGEQIQRAFPSARVVKALNTMNAMLMVDPTGVPGSHSVFVSGDDPEARARVRSLLGEWFGWKPDDVIELGDITTSRGVEMILPLWVRLMGALGTPMFNFHIARSNVSEQVSSST